MSKIDSPATTDGADPRIEESFVFEDDSANKASSIPLVCYSCGREYGSTSLAFHQKTCFERRVQFIQSLGLPDEFRPPVGEPVSLEFPQTGTDPISTFRAFNTRAVEIYKSQFMSKCPGCTRTFEPDRIWKHLLGCSEYRDLKKMSEVSIESPKKAMAATSIPLVCHICGKEYGSASLGIHLSTCRESRKNLIEKLGVPKAIRPAGIFTPGVYSQAESELAPMPAATTSTDLTDFRKYNEAAVAVNRKHFVCRCLGCSRGFEPENVIKHVKICKEMKGKEHLLSDSTGPSVNSNLTCFICGREYGSTSLGIHLVQCRPARTKFNEQFRSLPHACMRPMIGESPSTLIPSSAAMSPAAFAEAVAEYNREALDIFRTNSMSQCPHCMRRFEPDRIMTHFNSCRDSARRKSMIVEPSSSTKWQPSASPRTATSIPLMCHMCGREYGSSSIGIHLSTCRSSRINMLQTLDPPLPSALVPKALAQGAERIQEEEIAEGEDAAPKREGYTMPDLPQAQEDGNLAEFRRYNTISANVFKEWFMSRCPGCNRGFDPDRVLTHVKGCKECQKEDVKALLNATTPKASAESSNIVCYMCGREYGSSSIGIHTPQCIEKCKNNLRSLDLPSYLLPSAATNPPCRPEVDISETSLSEYNRIATLAYRENCMSQCPGCKRRFEPDRVLPHTKGCKDFKTIKDRLESEAAQSSASSGGPLFVACFMCGREYGTASIGIHLSTCRQSRANLIEGLHLPSYACPDGYRWPDGDEVVEEIDEEEGEPQRRHTERKVRPESTLPSSGDPSEVFRAWNMEATEIYRREWMSGCPGCNRRFEPNSIMTHVRGCNDCKSLDLDAMDEFKQRPIAAGVPTTAPSMVMCYMCGREFGTASIGIHSRQCLEKRRGLIRSLKLPLPLIPHALQAITPEGESDLAPPELPQNMDDKSSLSAYNTEASKCYRDQWMSRCPGCDRRVEPDRAEIHVKSCRALKEDEKMAILTDVAELDDTEAWTPRQIAIVATSRPLMCHLCGCEFGSASLGIHLQNCRQRRINLIRVLELPPDLVPPALREDADPQSLDLPPLAPLPTAVEPGGSLAEFGVYNDAANAVYRDGYMSRCPGCRRRFEPDRVCPHVRACAEVKRKGLDPFLVAATPPSSGPTMITCFCCGREFSLSSFGIHSRQCVEKRKAFIASLDLPPALVPIQEGAPEAPFPQDSSDKAGLYAYNAEAAKIYRDSWMGRCPGCDRRFEPDRIMLHARSCKDIQDPESVLSMRAKAASSSAPTTLVCYGCGREYGPGSLGFHLQNCLSLRLSNVSTLDLPPYLLPPAFTVAPPSSPRGESGSASASALEARRRRATITGGSSLTPLSVRSSFRAPQPVVMMAKVDGPKSQVPNSGDPSSIFEEYNREATEIYRKTFMSQCPGCRRRFEPDRVLTHTNGCQEFQSIKATLVDAPPSARGKGGAVTTCVCYICGQSYGSSSLGFHVQQCRVNRPAMIKSLELPDHLLPLRFRPDCEEDLAPKRLPPAPGDPSSSFEEYNAEATSIYKSHGMCECPGCRRRFEPDRVLTHAKSCKEAMGTPKTSGRPSSGSTGRALVCYCCGREYSSASLGIHTKTCIPARRALVVSLDLPKHLQPRFFSLAPPVSLSLSTTSPPNTPQSVNRRLSMRSPMRSPRTPTTPLFGIKSESAADSECASPRAPTTPSVREGASALPLAPTFQVPSESDAIEFFRGYNQESSQIYREWYMSQCPGCCRRFEPDRISTHVGGCKEYQDKKGAILALETPRESRALVVTCHICGMQYGCSSISIHLSTCKAKRKALVQTLLDEIPAESRPSGTGKPPDMRMPTSSDSPSYFDEYNKEATEIYRKYSMCPCAKCGRRFEPDRIAIHIRGCNETQPASGSAAEGQSSVSSVRKSIVSI